MIAHERRPSILAARDHSHPRVTAGFHTWDTCRPAGTDTAADNRIIPRRVGFEVSETQTTEIHDHVPVVHVGIDTGCPWHRWCLPSCPSDRCSSPGIMPRNPHVCSLHYGGAPPGAKYFSSSTSNRTSAVPHPSVPFIPFTGSGELRVAPVQKVVCFETAGSHPGVDTSTAYPISKILSTRAPPAYASAIGCDTRDRHQMQSRPLTRQSVYTAAGTTDLPSMRGFMVNDIIVIANI